VNADRRAAVKATKMKDRARAGWLPLAGVLAAAGASLCCVLPLAAALLGVGSAALGAQLEPWRPYLIGLTALLLGFAFRQAYRPAKADCGSGESCARPESGRPRRALLWVVAAVALLLVGFPYYVEWIF
jgi:mercuric ion transport protein